MIRFVFEDNINTPSSIALLSSYYGEYIHFMNDKRYGSGGNKKVAKFVKDLARKYPDDIFIVYFDLVPNNKMTIIVYENLCSSIEKYNGRVKVLPIPCIEYVIVNMLDRRNLLKYKKEELYYDIILHSVTTLTNWVVIKNIISNLGWKHSYIETIYKGLLNNHIKYCFHNRKGLGEFFTSCDRTTCDYCNISLKDCGDMIFMNLPFMIAPNKTCELNLNITPVSYDSVIDDIKLYYNKLEDYLGSDAEIVMIQTQ